MRKKERKHAKNWFTHRLNTVYQIIFFSCASIFIMSCQNNKPIDLPSLPDGASYIAETPQRVGDVNKGLNYLVNGDYLSSGIPYDIFKLVYTDSFNFLGRTGDAASVGFNWNVVTSSNGIKVVATNCLSCHATGLMGKTIIGLGNTSDDNTVSRANTLNTLNAGVAIKYGKTSKEWEAYYPFSRGFSSIAPYILTSTQGINPADKIFGALSVFRDPTDLIWASDGKPSFNIPIEEIPTDVPAWWLLKKKHALYYNGLGVGDFGRLSMASALVTMKDSAEARKIDNKFSDVMAYIKSIQAPLYPFTIDKTLADAGKVIYINTCSKCHGTYDAGNVTYPNLLIDQKSVNTDAALANVYSEYPQYHTWYNNSWFAKGANSAQLLPTKGYVAPPLDGIWATAPYLHNGSIPTLYDLLNSTSRPKYWERTFDNTDYDQTKLGWNYTIKSTKESTKTYDTTLKGYTNVGHYYGDKLTDAEKKQLIEYLKML